MLEEDARVDRAVTKEAEESGELRRESSNMYLSISSKNSSIPSWYIAMTREPSISRYTSRMRRERTVCCGEGEMLVDIKRRWEFFK